MLVYGTVPLTFIFNTTEITHDVLVVDEIPAILLGKDFCEKVNMVLELSPDVNHVIIWGEEVPLYHRYLDENSKTMGILVCNVVKQHFPVYTTQPIYVPAELFIVVLGHCPAEWSLTKDALFEPRREGKLMQELSGAHALVRPDKGPVPI